MPHRTDGNRLVVDASVGAGVVDVAGDVAVGAPGTVPLGTAVAAAAAAAAGDADADGTDGKQLSVDG